MKTNKQSINKNILPSPSLNLAVKGLSWVKLLARVREEGWEKVSEKIMRGGMGECKWGGYEKGQNKWKVSKTLGTTFRVAISYQPQEGNRLRLNTRLLPLGRRLQKQIRLRLTYFIYPILNETKLT